MSRFATDLLRVIAVTFIVYNHLSWRIFINVGTGYEDALSLAIAALNQLGKPSVLFFLFLSGFAFGAHPVFGRARPGEFPAARFYSNRVLRILPPYLLASFLAFWFMTESRGYFIGLFDGSNLYHLYFVALLLYLYVLYPALQKLEYTPLRAALLATPAFLIHPFLAHPRAAEHPLAALIGPEGAAWLQAIHDYVHALNHGRVEIWLIYFCYALPFFVYGLWAGRAGRHPDQPRWRFHAASAALPVLCALVFFDFYSAAHNGQHADSAGRIWRLSVAAYALVFIEWMRGLPDRDSGPTLRVLARASFLVYLFHPFVIKLFEGAHFFVQALAVIPLSWALGLALHFIARSHRIFGFILGEGDRQLTGHGPRAAASQSRA